MHGGMEKIELKNQAETLCFEAEKELLSVKNQISEEKQKTITQLIENIRQDIQNDQLDSAKSSIEKLKVAMKEMIEAKLDNESNSDPMSNLNDL